MNSDNAKSFMNETGLYDVFAEVNGVEEDKRETTCQHGSAWIDHVLAADGMLRKAKGCELTECSELVESDHRGQLTDVDLAENFSEDFAKDDEIAERNLNPNRKTHRENFVQKCNKLLDSICTERDLNDVNVKFNRSKIEQTDSETTHVLMKTRKCAKGDTTRNDKSSEQRKLRATLAYWKLKLSEKYGKHADACKMPKRADMAGLKANSGSIRSEIKLKI